jgi:hypothetical protein
MLIFVSLLDFSKNPNNYKNAKDRLRNWTIPFDDKFAAVFSCRNAFVFNFLYFF